MVEINKMGLEEVTWKLQQKESKKEWVYVYV